MRHALVVYESMFGNTQQVATAIADGLRGSFDVTMTEVSAAPKDVTADVELLVVGGPTGDPVQSTLMFMVVIYQNAFRYFKMGYASAQAVLLFLAVLAITGVIYRTARVWVFTESDETVR